MCIYYATEKSALSVMFSYLQTALLLIWQVQFIEEELGNTILRCPSYMLHVPTIRDGSQFSNIRLVDLFIEYRIGCAIMCVIIFPMLSVLVRWGRVSRGKHSQ